MLKAISIMNVFLQPASQHSTFIYWTFTAADSSKQNESFVSCNNVSSKQLLLHRSRLYNIVRRFHISEANFPSRRVNWNCGGEFDSRTERKSRKCFPAWKRSGKAGFVRRWAIRRWSCWLELREVLCMYVHAFMITLHQCGYFIAGTHTCVCWCGKL